MIGALFLVSAAAVCLRPEAFSAGSERVLWGVGAFLGTVAAGTVPLVALASGFVVSTRLSDRGEAMALGSMGVAPVPAWRALWPLWLVLTAATLAIAFAIEAPAWRVVHQLRGASEVAAVSWNRLQAGEVRVLPKGGALVARDGAMRFASGDGGWRGSAGSVVALVGDRDWGWRVADAKFQHADGSLWSARDLRLRADVESLARSREQPRSPWSLPTERLIAAAHSADARPAVRNRAGLVLHRRFALASLVPTLALLGWLLAWSPLREGRRDGRRHLVVALLAVSLYALLKSGEKVVAAGLLPGVLGAWLPVLPFLLASVLLSVRAGKVPR